VLGAVSIEGRDPLAERKAAATRGCTVAQLAERYMTEHAEVKKKPASAKTDRQMLRDYVQPKLGHLAVADVSRQDVAALHHGLHEKPYLANRVLALVSKMLNLAERWGLRPDGSNPCRHVEKFKEYKRERYLTSEELSRLTQAIAEAEAEGTESVHALAALRLLILTGCRLREILRLRWEHVDFEHGRLALPDSKTGAKTVFLATAAQEVLAGIPRTEGCPWVIEGRKPKTHLSDLKGPWRRLSQKAELKDLRIHDLRHSFAAVGAGLGLSLPMIGKLLGHTQPRTTARYAHLAADPMHEAVERIGERLMEVGGGSQEATGRSS
jgi:integrase